MTDCPHPEKHRHVSMAAALVHIEAMDRQGKADLNLHPYPCAGHWHIGHRSKGRKSQLKAALIQGRRASRAARRRRKR